MAGIDSYTKLCLHCDGTDGSTTIPDSSTENPKGNATVAGDAQLDTAQYKFATASLLLDGTGDYITVATTADFNFGTDVWTVDFWVRFNDLTAVRQFFFEIWQDAGDSIRLRTQPGIGVAFYWLIGGVNEGSWTLGGSNFSTGTWYHIALVRYGTGQNNMYFFIDGVSKSIVWAENLLADQAAPGDSSLRIGDSLDEADSYFLNGWIDEFRISKGIARWTANFTPPTAPYDTNQEISLKDTITLSDRLSNKLTRNLFLKDTLNLSDSILLIKQLSKVFNDSIVISDLLNLKKSKLLFLSDQIILTDYVTAIKDLIIRYLNLYDTISLSDNLSKTCYYLVLFNDGITLTDSIGLQKYLTTYLYDSITLEDTLKLGQGLNRIFTDTIQITERDFSLVSNASDPVVISRDPQISAGQNRQLLSILGVSDAKPVKLEQGRGLDLWGGNSFKISSGSIINLLYNATDNTWRETSRGFEYTQLGAG